MNILIVDDEVKFADRLAERLQLRGFETKVAYDGGSALSLLAADHFDGMILDLRLPDTDGIEILKKAREKAPFTRVVILSGHGTEQDFKTCLKLGATACFQKPVNISKLMEAIAGAEIEGHVLV